ncbi:MAG: NYN domain-containing protein [Deltaproteobacteria bacterium]|nr:NYN domain-containing protein [Deltaproteobacteria bacterium]MBW2532395.1 NYN domain-containing protein [Deltaproteobacteria bacterium]
MADEPLIAVFIDYENLALGVRDVQKDDVNVELPLKRFLEKGRIVYKRAYCDWSHYRGAVRKLHQLGVVMVDIPQSRASGKNSADIHMVVDAMDLCFSKEHIGVFALLSGDSDFTPLAHKLKELDKRVIGCGVKSSTSPLLVASCDEFIYYDDLVQRAAKPKRTTSRGRGRAKTPDVKSEALDQLMELVRSLAEDYENVWASMVKQTMARVHPGFTHQSYGYDSFIAMLQDAQKRGLVELEFDKSRGNYRIHVNRS